MNGKVAPERRKNMNCEKTPILEIRDNVVSALLHCIVIITIVFFLSADRWQDQCPMESPPN